MAATDTVYPTGWDAHNFLAIKSENIQNAVYIVVPEPGFGPGPWSYAEPETDLANRPLSGGGPQAQLPLGSGGPGTVFGPIPIPTE
jgi:hypothetical protein